MINLMFGDRIFFYSKIEMVCRRRAKEPGGVKRFGQRNKTAFHPRCYLTLWIFLAMAVGDYFSSSCLHPEV
jgi:hypothetical protein